MKTLMFLRERARCVESKCFNKYITNIEHLITFNPKLFWTYMKGKRGNSSYLATMTYSSQSSDNALDIVAFSHPIFNLLF